MSFNRQEVGLGCGWDINLGFYFSIQLVLNHFTHIKHSTGPALVLLKMSLLLTHICIVNLIHTVFFHSVSFIQDPSKCLEMSQRHYHFGRKGSVYSMSSSCQHQQKRRTVRRTEDMDICTVNSNTLTNTHPYSHIRLQQKLWDHTLTQCTYTHHEAWHQSTQTIDSRGVVDR